MHHDAWSCKAPGRAPKRDSRHPRGRLKVDQVDRVSVDLPCTNSPSAPAMAYVAGVCTDAWLRSGNSSAATSSIFRRAMSRASRA